MIENKNNDTSGGDLFFILLRIAFFIAALYVIISKM